MEVVWLLVNVAGTGLLGYGVYKLISWRKSRKAEKRRQELIELREMLRDQDEKS